MSVARRTPARAATITWRWTRMSNGSAAKGFACARTTLTGGGPARHAMVSPDTATSGSMDFIRAVYARHGRPKPLLDCADPCRAPPEPVSVPTT